MKKNLHKVLGLLLALVMLLSVMSACSKTDDKANDTPSGTNTSTNAGDAADTTSTGSAEGSSVTIAWADSKNELAPIRSTGSTVYPEMIMLYERLMYLTADGEYVPWLIKEYSTTDGMNYDFEIYDYITDSQGNNITAQDIVFIINKCREAALNPDFSKVASIEATGDYTVHIELNQDRVYCFESLMWGTYVVSQAAYEASPDGMATTPVSTSAYVLTDFTPGATMTLEKRDDYWQTDASLIPAGMEAKTQKVTFNTVSELSQRVIAVETGVADMAWDIEASSIDSFVDNTDYTVLSVPDMEGVSLYFSGSEERAISGNLALRQAICYAIDPNALIQGVAFGEGEPMHDVCAPTGLGYNEKWNSEDYFTRDLDKAKELLEQAGYQGEEIELCTFGSWQRMGEIIQSSCNDAGINIKLNIIDDASIGQYRANGAAWDMTLWSYSTPSLAYNWSLAFDSNAFGTGDSMSRKDETLTDMIYNTWINGAYTEENIDAVHYYIMDHAYARGLFLRNTYMIVRADANLTDEVRCYRGYLAPWACTFGD